MAEEIGFQVKVGGADSLASLKKEFKDLQKELEKTEVGTSEYQKTLEKLGRVKDDIGDLRDAITALNPEGKVAAFQNVAGKLAGGFQAATGAAALFGAQSAELEKQLLKVQAATALAEGIQSVVGLSDAFVVLKTAVMATNPVFLVLAGVLAGIATAYALWKNVIGETAKADAALNSELERQAANQDIITKQIGRQLELQKLTAKNKSDELKFEQEAEIKLLASIQTREFLLKQVKDKTDEQKKELADLRQQDADSYNRLLILKINIGRALRDEEKQRLDELAAKEITKVKEVAQVKKREIIEYEKLEGDAISMIAAQQEKESLAEQERLKQVAKLEAENQAIRVANFLEEEKLRKEREAAEKAAAQEQTNAKLQAEENFFNAAQGLSTAFFQTQLMMAEGNAAETDKIRRKQFQAEKAFSVARAIIDGYRAVNAALVIPPPAGPILAASNALLAAASVAKILSTQYNSTSTAGGGGISLPSSSASSSIPMPTIAAPVNPQASTQLNAQGYNVSKVVVVEKDITTVQNRINRLKVQATY
jgi:hypothetical protein